ncbi:MAG: hypothetical protein M1812_007860 [Candelaria pacifica]|nr:MAG: hypothetical protein M1812_007860 [Candelaria pacifica]
MMALVFLKYLDTPAVIPAVMNTPSAKEWQLEEIGLFDPHLPVEAYSRGDIVTKAIEAPSQQNRGAAGYSRQDGRNTGEEHGNCRYSEQQPYPCFAQQHEAYHGVTEQDMSTDQPYPDNQYANGDYNKPQMAEEAYYLTQETPPLMCINQAIAARAYYCHECLEVFATSSQLQYHERDEHEPYLVSVFHAISAPPPPPRYAMVLASIENPNTKTQPICLDSGAMHTLIKQSCVADMPIQTGLSRQIHSINDTQDCLEYVDLRLYIPGKGGKKIAFVTGRAYIIDSLKVGLLIGMDLLKVEGMHDFNSFEILTTEASSPPQTLSN